MSSDTHAVSSLPRVVAHRNGPLVIAPPNYLARCLPELTSPPGWTPVGSGELQTTRMMLRRVGTASYWDGSEILNIYQVPGQVPRGVVLADTDRSLRDSGAVNIYCSEIAMPASYRTIGARATGNLDLGPRPLRAQYTYYVVNGMSGTALIEQVIVIGLDVLARLLPEVEVLSSSLHRSLMSSIEISDEYRQQ